MAVRGRRVLFDCGFELLLLVPVVVCCAAGGGDDDRDWARRKQQATTKYNVQSPRNAATSMLVGAYETPTPSVWYAPIACSGIIAK